MFTATDNLVSEYKLLELEYALVMNLQFEVIWATANMKSLQFIDNSNNFTLPYDCKNMFFYFLEQIQQQQTESLLLPIIEDNKQILYHIKGTYDNLRQLIVLIFIKVGESKNTTPPDNPPKLFNYFRQGILITTINHSIVHFNQYVEKMIPKQFLQLDADIRKLFSEEIITVESLETMVDILRSKKSYTGNCTVAGTPMRMIIYFDELVNQYIYIFEDVNELLQLKREITNQEYLSEIGKMASTIVHEMRNPMTAIKGYVDLMLMNQKPEMGYMRIIERELTHLNQLCGDILFLSKPMQKTVKGVDLLQVVKEVKQLLEVEVEGKEVDLIFTYNERSTYIVAGNEMYFKQVVMNIIKNAVQAIEEKGVVEIVLKEKIHSVELSVKDTGCGIEEEIIDTVFDMFYTTKDYGTGLGLPVVKKIVDQLNGHIDVKSTIGIGTNFTISFPTIH